MCTLKCKAHLFPESLETTDVNVLREPKGTTIIIIIATKPLTNSLQSQTEREREYKGWTEEKNRVEEEYKYSVGIGMTQYGTHNAEEQR